MKYLLSLVMLVGVVSCNAILGISDLSQSDAGGGGDGGGDGGGGDGGGQTARVRFLLLTPDVFDINPTMASVEVRLVGGAKLVDATYGVVTDYVDVPVGADQLELQTSSGDTVTVGLSFGSTPTPETAYLGVIAGMLATDGEPVRLLAVDQASIATSGGTTALIVNAVTDVKMVHYAAQADVAGVPSTTAPLVGLLSTTVDGSLPDQQMRLRVGQGPINGPGMEAASFTVPAQAVSSFMVLGGLMHQAASAAPGLMLYVIPSSPAGAPVTVIKQDPAFLVANFMVDYSNETTWIADSTSGARLSVMSSQRETPMLFFGRPSEVVAARVDGLANQLSLGIGAAPAGTRTFIALTGYDTPVNPQPASGFLSFAEYPDDPTVSGRTQVMFVHASPDPSSCDVVFVASDASETSQPGAVFGEPFGPLAVVTGAAATIRVLPPGGTTPIASFPALDIQGRRQITVFSGAQSGSDEPLHVTSVDMNVWPWEISAPIPGQ